MHFVQGREEPLAVHSAPRLPSAQGLHFQESLWLSVLWSGGAGQNPPLPAPAGAAEPPEPELSTLLFIPLCSRQHLPDLLSKWMCRF